MVTGAEGSTKNLRPHRFSGVDVCVRQSPQAASFHLPELYANGTVGARHFRQFQIICTLNGHLLKKRAFNTYNRLLETDHPGLEIDVPCDNIGCEARQRGE